MEREHVSFIKRRRYVLKSVDVWYDMLPKLSFTRKEGTHVHAWEI